MLKALQVSIQVAAGVAPLERRGCGVVALRFLSPDPKRYRTIGMRQCSAFDSLEIVARLPRRMVCWRRKRTCRGVSVGCREVCREVSETGSGCG